MRRGADDMSTHRACLAAHLQHDAAAYVAGWLRTQGKAESIIQAVKASGQGIRIPGETSSRVAEERRAAGKMPIPVGIWESICKTAEEGLPK